MLSSGDLFSVGIWQTTTSLLFTGFLGLLINYVDKPLTVILDNASFHKAKALQPMLKVLAQKGSSQNLMEQLLAKYSIS